MNDILKEFQYILYKSKRIVFFGGAGVSTESGIPDFRSVDGLYNQKWAFPPEEILSSNFFYNKTVEFYKFYHEKLLVDGIKPNAAHLKLAELEKAGKLSAVITQNIDGLHQAAGSKKVLELHGSILRNYCTKCNSFYDSSYIKTNSFNGKIPLCNKCGSLIKPDVVLYGESLNQNVIEESIRVLEEADLLIIGGTSLTVYPAAGLISYYKGDKLVLINRDPTPSDVKATLVIHDPIAQVFSQIKINE